MKLYLPGETSKAICSDCKDIVSTTFMVRDVPIAREIGIVRAILVSVCNDCLNVVAIPAQSATAIQHAVGTLDR